MIRAFVAIDLPDDVLFELRLVQQGLPVTRPVAPKNMHLTLAFLGDVAESALEEAHYAFDAIRAERFDLALSGVGMFGGHKPRVVYVGVRESPALMHLQAKVEQAARRAGLTPDSKRYIPHVTLGRLIPGRFDGARLERAVAERADFAAPPFTVADFRLYRSDLRPGGPIHSELARYPLG
ncbi:RNA 2',3'-cyclic phosphodiesterase [Actibacterium sp. MT2.3-13A]|uniref:RNA 2',3'-cyclic phosphodiesterase n=1 Tax=Actibacterium sp. MT2.3-13A TaxID=2828332 RepID=UPI001BA7C480|nr:RNA 2',3'-cyclic phosphodiesterase [Actibacterium sp. MT2.3-13A]